jgi:hypothetical protein
VYFYKHKIIYSLLKDLQKEANRSNGHTLNKIWSQKGQLNAKNVYLNIWGCNIWMLLISSCYEYIPKNRPPLEKKSTRCVNCWKRKRTVLGEVNNTLDKQQRTQAVRTPRKK